MQLPDELNADLAEILGILCFDNGPIARAMRAGGTPIPRKVEAEQAAVLFKLLGIYAEHGPAWRKAAAEWLEGVIARARAAKVGSTA